MMAMGKGGTSISYLSDMLGLKGHQTTCVICAETLKSYLRDHALRMRVSRKRLAKGGHICQLSEAGYAEQVVAEARKDHAEAAARRRRIAERDVERQTGAQRSPSGRDVQAELRLMGQLDLPLKASPSGG